ncbi:MAG: polysaccharide lyase [Verrucomicrobia bacterium]|nr:polysaccharide lyase [Verrucomicrobiota bacterium]
MKKTSATSFITFGLIAWSIMAAPLSARVIFEAGYENGLENNGNAGIKVVEPEDDRIEASTNVSRVGSGSVRTELRYGDMTPVSVRSESSVRDAGGAPIIQRGVVRFYAFSVYLAPGYQQDSNGDILFQIKQGSSGPSFHFMADEGKFKFHYTNNDQPKGVTSPYFEESGYRAGIWYDFVLEFLPQYTSDGYFKFFYKKASESEYTELIHYTGSTLIHDRDGYIKWGIYKSTWARKPTDSTLRVVYHDNIKVATTFDEVRLPAYLPENADAGN